MTGTLLTGLLVGLGGGAGAAARYALQRRLDADRPWGVLVANVVGSALLGVFSALALAGTLSAEGLALLGTGFCGGFTTYSTFAVGTHDLGARRGWAYAALTTGLSLAACAACFALTGVATGLPQA
ncbi:CrcB family protein [Nocardioides sp. CFH 31398]|uniref:FluC/FEX family fluoride channel n=1 Tax=Nocardioides sp. CFH 31398 TaxID=2919579 RepID=UPI001F0515CA|nr:CrcB family protein [Nocardioides sp. CFH 31398]MCH1866068.1 CrcB family protein [Nocardioides sp. CFH 31398]